MTRHVVYLKKSSLALDLGGGYMFTGMYYRGTADTDSLNIAVYFSGDHYLFQGNWEKAMRGRIDEFHSTI